MHCEFFPHNRSIEESLVLEVKEIIVHATSGGDSLAFLTANT